MSEQTMEKHPPGLYVLFSTEMWERFSFYTMLAVLMLYMKDPIQGFGWSTAQATSVYSWYSAFVYASPLLGGFIADRFLGYRYSITIGAIFFFIGQCLLTTSSVTVFYMALACLVIGNGFFKPNISSIVGNLYKEGSNLKDRAYLVFYMGINIGAALAPVIAEVLKMGFGYRSAFLAAAAGMVISMIVFWGLKRHIMQADRLPLWLRHTEQEKQKAKEHAERKKTEMELVPEWKRISALILIFLLVIVFWMIFHQNGITLTLWANDHTNWNVSGVISNAINPLWIITLALPLSWFWGWLDTKGLEPHTPTKIMFGMFLTGVSFMILYAAAVSGGYTKQTVAVLKEGPSANQYYVDLPQATKEKLNIQAPPTEIEYIKHDPQKGDVTLKKNAWLVSTTAPMEIKKGDFVRIDEVSEKGILVSTVLKMSAFWLILAYFVISLGELMLSPMGLSLVSKVAPVHKRGLMMGGWFLATAIGNKLTAIGAYWDVWSHSDFFLVLALMAFGMSVVLFALLKPLKKAMPGA